MGYRVLNSEIFTYTEGDKAVYRKILWKLLLPKETYVLYALWIFAVYR